MLDSSSFSQNNGLTLKRAGQPLCFIDANIANHSVQHCGDRQHDLGSIREQSRIVIGRE
jgi:hypothetical protein